MGFYQTMGASKRDVVDELLDPKGQINALNGVTQWLVIDKALVGNHLWTVRESVDQKSGFPLAERMICLFALAGDAGGGREGWGYRPCTEADGPLELDCPVRFFELVPEPPNDWAKVWRENVRAELTLKAGVRRKMRDVRIGQRYTLPPSCTPKSFIVTRVKPIRGLGEDGRIYSIGPKFFSKATIDKEHSSDESPIAQLRSAFNAL